MLFIMSISAPVPCVIGELAGGAGLSACRRMAKAKVRIAIHLILHGIRRSSQAPSHRYGPISGPEVMPDRVTCYAALGSMPDTGTSKLEQQKVAGNARRVARRELRGHRSCHRHIRLGAEPA